MQQFKGGAGFQERPNLVGRAPYADAMRLSVGGSITGITMGEFTIQAEDLTLKLHKSARLIKIGHDLG